MRYPPPATPTLFDAIADPAIPSDPPGEEKRTAGPAKDFVRWCCSFGPEFRNSPDLANLRYWAQKTKLKLKDKESEVLATARLLFFKRLDLVTRKAEQAEPADCPPNSP